MSIKEEDIKEFQLVHTIKGRSTVTRFSKEDFPLFRQWVESCIQNHYDYEASLITREGRIYRIH